MWSPMLLTARPTLDHAPVGKHFSGTGASAFFQLAGDRKPPPPLPSPPERKKKRETAAASGTPSL